MAGKKVASSQQDMFGDSGNELLKREALSRISSTLDTTKKKIEYRYLWVVLFSWDVDSEQPFQVHKLSIFNDSDIREECISKNLGNKSRISTLTNLSPFPGGTFSLFSKIAMGATKREIGDYVRGLNDKFKELASKPGSSMKACLWELVESTPYR